MISVILRLIIGVLSHPLAVTLLIALLLVQGWWLVGPGDEPLGFARRNIAARTAAVVALELPGRDGITTIAVLPLRNDPNEIVTRRLTDAIGERGRYEIVYESLFRRILARLRWAPPPPSSVADAVSAARQIGADGVVFGEVIRFTGAQGEAMLGVDIRMAERDSGDAVFGKHYEEVIAGAPAAADYWRARLADSGKPQRVVLWVMFVLLLPVVTAPLIRRVTVEDSNALNLGLLVVYTALGVAAAWGLTGFWVPSWWTALALLLALGACAAYNFKIATILDELRR